MEICYETKDAEKKCTDFSYAKKKLPKDVAEKLASHINYIEQAEKFSDIINYPPFNFHKLLGDRKGYYALDVGRRLGYRIIIEPLDDNGDSLIKENDMKIITNCTKIVLVLEVTNHYD